MNAEEFSILLIRASPEVEIDEGSSQRGSFLCVTSVLILAANVGFRRVFPQTFFQSGEFLPYTFSAGSKARREREREREREDSFTIDLRGR